MPRLPPFNVENFVFLDALPTAAATLKGVSRSEHGCQVNFVLSELRSRVVFSDLV